MLGAFSVPYMLRPQVGLVIPAATYRAAPFIDAATALDVEVVVITDQVAALGSAVVSYSMLTSTVPIISVRLLASRGIGPLQAVLAVDGAGVALAAALAEQFALPHNPLDATLAAGDKAAQREQFEEAGVPQPSFRFLSVSEDPAELGASLGWPCVVKQ